MVGCIDPAEETGFGVAVLPADAGEALIEGVTALAVDGHLLFHVGMVVVFEGDFAGDLDGVELPRVNIAFDLSERGDDGGVAGGPADTPSGHVETLGKRVELDGDIHGAVDFENALGRFFEVDFAVGEVVGDDPAVLVCQSDGLLVKGKRSSSGSGIIGIVQPDKLGFLLDIFRNGVEVGEEVVFFEQRHDVGLAAGENSACIVNGVGGLWDEHDVAVVDDGEREVGEAVLGADGRENLRVRVDIDMESFLHESRRRLTESGNAFIEGIAMIFGIVDSLGHLINDELVRRQVGIADAEVDDVLAGSQKRAFFLIDLNEKVRRKSLETLRLGERHCGVLVKQNKTTSDPQS